MFTFNITQHADVEALERRLDTLDRKLDRILGVLNIIRALEGKEMQELDNLQTQITAMSDAVASVEQLLTQIGPILVADIQNAKDLAEAKQKATEFAATLQSKSAELAAAVVANTPAAPTAATARKKSA